MISDADLMKEFVTAFGVPTLPKPNLLAYMSEAGRKKLPQRDVCEMLLNIPARRPVSPVPPLSPAPLLQVTDPRAMMKPPAPIAPSATSASLQNRPNSPHMTSANDSMYFSQQVPSNPSPIPQQIPSNFGQFQGPSDPIRRRQNFNPTPPQIQREGAWQHPNTTSAWGPQPTNWQQTNYGQPPKLNHYVNC
ncbi:unnamed protein product [Bursaphelenchus xylophilus]|uniref:(pine wood nematode) hypothetical protein n=1 Tax=Bursaphelenchus xylophilus TaxID=6326 RepID=A0A1I7RMW8_BURXY|nr:unnamed protein product [Bursaphelenchus xylophilus]CAG9125385.1 unnamed protein product [Bursaphelenchus xylophilus]